MSITAFIILGLAVFAGYLFFLLRMVWKQHRIQKKNPNQNPEPKPYFRIERSEEKRQAS